VLDIRMVVTALLAVGAGIAASGLAGFSAIQPLVGGLAVRGRPSGIFSEPNGLGAFAAVILVLGVGVALSAERGLQRVVSFVAVATALVVLIASLSRGAWMGGAVGLLVLFMLLRTSPAALIRAALLTLLAAGIALGGLLLVQPTAVDVVHRRLGTVTQTAGGLYNARPIIWREAVRQISADPWSGQGPGNFAVASLRARSVGRAGVQQYHHAHSLFLNVAAEVGIGGVAFLVGLIVSIIMAVRRRLRGLHWRDRAFLAGIAGALAVFPIHGAVDYTLGNPLLSILAWLLIGLILASPKEAEV
ncbi:MAG: O-antigen ligase family protein, partial [Actinomycetota bacterium]|nr:O-antigen ligase family protein [Actinomycetota bacterium]